MNKKICIIGLGYVGLPTASLMATKGCKVLGVDTSLQVVSTINKGEAHIVEPDLDVLVKSAIQSGNLVADTEPAEADVFIIAVPTPFCDDLQPDLRYIEDATRAIAPKLSPGNLVVLESTCPVGTTDELIVPILEDAGHAVSGDVFVAYSPERILPGRILIEMVVNDRIVGGVDEASTEVAVEFYAEFVHGEIHSTDARTAEMVKLSENAYRDVNIAFANELSMICDTEGISPWAMIELANRHPRVNILRPGPGVGGHCIAVDPWFIVARAGGEARLIRTAREVNNLKPGWVLEKVRRTARKFKEPVIACLGLAYKADVGDLRESPALDIVRRIHQERLGEILVSEPNVPNHPEFELTDAADAVARADIVLVLVDHKQFRALNRYDLKEKLKEKVVIDTRGVIV